MTKAIRWPNNAAHARDRAAEEINDSIQQINKLLLKVDRGKFTREELEINLLRLHLRLQTAVRHLEAVGAKTKPD